MKRRVFEVITLLFLSTFVLTPVMAHTFGDSVLPDPSTEKKPFPQSDLYVLGILSVWHPGLPITNIAAGKPTTKVNKENHRFDIEHDDYIDILDLVKALELTDANFPSKMKLANFGGLVGVAMSRDDGITRINAVLEKYDNSLLYRTYLGEHGHNVLTKIRTLLYDRGDVSKNGTIDFVDLISTAEKLRKTQIPNPKTPHFGVVVPWTLNWKHWADVDLNSAFDTRDVTYVTSHIKDTSVAAAKIALASTELRDEVQKLTITAEAIDLWLTDSAVLASGKTQTALDNLKTALAPPADVDRSGAVDFEDLIHMCNAVKDWIATGTVTDADGDGDVDVDDILFVAGKITPIDETKSSILDFLWDPMLKIKPVFTRADIDAWKALATGNAVTVLDQLSKGLVVAWQNVDGDGDIDFADIIKVGNAINGNTPSGVNPDADRTGSVNVRDVLFVASGVAQGDISLQDARDAVRSTPPVFTAADVKAWIVTASGEQHIQAVLHHLKDAIETIPARRAPQGATNGDAMPKKTELLANYPNPFNPETWIPYQLATPAEVSIAIYAADGKQVRTLNIGHLPAGTYYEKDRAAYWDGKNAQGEPVASGLYFYTFTAGEFTATQKMLIRK